MDARVWMKCVRAHGVGAMESLPLCESTHALNRSEENRFLNRVLKRIPLGSAEKKQRMIDGAENRIGHRLCIFISLSGFWMAVVGMHLARRISAYLGWPRDNAVTAAGVVKSGCLSSFVTYVI